MPKESEMSSPLLRSFRFSSDKLQASTVVKITAISFSCVHHEDVMDGRLKRIRKTSLIEGWFVACSRWLSGLYRVSSRDQRTRRVKEQTGGPDQGNLKLFVPQFYIFSMVLPGNLDSFPVSSL